jgi:arylsulfatase A-like enzyme
VRANGLDNALFVPTSAHRFISTQLPAFRFDQVSTVPDHEEGVELWGYGADRPTGDALGERFREWLAEKGDRRFFAWIYNFDLHAWRQLRDEYFTGAARAVSPDEQPNLRYRAVAGMVDRAFGAMLRGLEEAKIADRTIVLLLSDHGEALGYRGVFAHSAFLWQPLVRVPLVLRVPGLAPRVVQQSVSLVDVAPTLARFVEPSAPMRDYHGLDLMRFLVAPATTRTLPILMQASSEGRPSYLGIVVPDRKLVVPAGGGPAQLHDLDHPDPDSTDLSVSEPARAAELARILASSPLLRN